MQSGKGRAQTWLDRLKRLLLGALVFVTPLLYTTGNTDYNVPKVAFALAVVGLLLLLWGVEMVWRRSYPFQRTGLAGAFAALLLAMLLSLPGAENARQGVESVAIFTYFFLLLLFVANTVERRRDAGIALGGLLAAAALAAAYGLLQYYGALSPTDEPLGGPMAMVSTFGNKNVLGGFLAAVLWPGVMLLVFQRRIWLKAGLLAGLLPIGWAVTMLNSDSVWLALLVSGLFLAGTVALLRLGRPLADNRWWLLGLLAGWALTVVSPSPPVRWNSVDTFAQTPAGTADVPLFGRWAGGEGAPGVYRAKSGGFQWRGPYRLESVNTGSPDGVPLAGDWFGRGRDEVGVYGDGTLWLDGDGDGWVEWGVSGSASGGAPEAQPLAGDWNGDGLSKLGFYRPASQTFALRAGLDAGAGEDVVPAPYAAPGDWPLAGDWNGDGRDDPGVYRPGEAAFLLDADRDGAVDARVALAATEAGDLPVVGGGSGGVVLGVYRPATETFYWDDDRDGRIDRTQGLAGAAWPSFLKSSALIRLQNWLIAWEMWLDHPWFGVGQANFKLNHLPYKARLLETPLGRSLEAVEEEVGDIPRTEYAHNEFVQLVAELGTAGLLALAYALFALARLGRRALRARGEKSTSEVERRWVAASACAGLVAVLSDSAFSFPLYMAATGLTFAVLLGVLGSRHVGAGPSVVLGRRVSVPVLVGLLALNALVWPAAARDYGADLALREGRLLLLQNQAQAGEAKLLESVDLDFEPEEALLYLGFLYERTGQWARCVEYNVRSLKSHGSEFPYLYLGTCRLQLGEYEAAFESLHRLVALDPQAGFEGELLRTFSALTPRAEALWAGGERTTALYVIDEIAALCGEAALSWSGCAEADVRRAAWRRESGLGGGSAAAQAVLAARVARTPDFVPADLALAGLLEGDPAQRVLAMAQEICRRRLEWLERADPPADQAEARTAERARWRDWLGQVLAAEPGGG